MSEAESSSAEAPVAEAELDVEANAQVEDQTEETSEEGDQPEPEDDSEEVDYEGQKYKVPKALKDAILRQADYTQKTQALAEQRRTVEARATELQQQAEAKAATYEDRVKLAMYDAQLEQLNGIDWGARAREVGSEQALAEMSQVSQLKTQRDALAGEVTAKENEFRLNGQKAEEAALQEANEILSREVQGFGADMVRDVAQVGQSLGFSADELRHSFVGEDGKADTRTFKALAELHRLRAENADLKAKQTKAQTAEKVAKVQPAATVNAKAGQYKPGLNDDLPADEWLRRRQAQLDKRAKA